MVQENNMIVGLDIGTSKIACIVAEHNTDGELAIIGLGTHPSIGLKKGVVIDVHHTIDAIRMAVEEAELMTGVAIKCVNVGISGSHIWSSNNQGVVAIEGEQVTDDDVSRVINAARAWLMPENKKILHVIPQQYTLDALTGVRNPLGMCGARLEAQVHMVTGDAFAIQNIMNCCERCNLDVSHLVLEQIASGEGVLASDEKEIGVLMVDIGGGTTDLAIFKHGYICHTTVIPIGGDHMTNDLAMGLRISTKEATHLKIKYGNCMMSLVSREETVQVNYVGDREPEMIPRQRLVQFLEPRLQELFQLIREDLMSTRYTESLAAGIVLTGGSSLLNGIQTLAEEVFEMPVRIGRPQDMAGLLDVVSSPIYATGVGLVKYAHSYREPTPQHQNEKQKWYEIGSRFMRWIGR
ncbi:MAG: cell division protein FtsA [Ghiorsea sp.]|nr:cell division protein FtsA [Ghiorsea sp.]